MPTSDERSEVAERLRMGADVPSIEGFTFKTLINAALTDGQPMPINDAELMSCLADLIDPTCEMEDVGEVPELAKRNLSTWSCSECGSPIYNDMTPTYCTYCGARVVSGDE